MQLMVIKVFFEKFWNFIKEHWKFFFGFLVAVLGAMSFREKGDAKTVLQNEKDASKKELEAIKASEELLKNKTKDAQYTYDKTVREVEKKFVEDKKQLSEDVKKKVQEIVQSSGDDASEITSRISELTGYEIYVEED